LTSSTIEFALDCPRSLLRDLYDSARRFRKTAYFCGVFFGRRNGPVIRIDAWRGDSAGPSRGGLLENVNGETSRVERVLTEALSDTALEDLKPIGWFVARREGDLVPQPPEVELYDRLFPEPWQVTLLVRPEGTRGRARFFGRGTQPTGTLVINDNQIGESSGGEPRSTTRVFLWVLALSGWLLLVALSLTAWLQPGVVRRLLPASREVPLRLAASAGGLELAWDQDAVRAFGVQRATLDLHFEGDSKHFELAEDEISSGAFFIETPVRDAAMEMVFFPDTGAPIHSYARFLIPQTPPMLGASPRSANYAGERATRSRVQPLGHAPGKVR
jgi:hypothetical protein